MFGKCCNAVSCCSECNGATQGGSTALHWAAEEGHMDVVRCLVEQFHADINLCTIAVSHVSIA